MYVSAPGDVMEVMRVGDSNRAKAATNMNEHSSRSHSIFCLSIEKTSVRDGSKTKGTLGFVVCYFRSHGYSIHLIPCMILHSLLHLLFSLRPRRLQGQGS